MQKIFIYKRYKLWVKTLHCRYQGMCQNVALYIADFKGMCRNVTLYIADFKGICQNVILYITDFKGMCQNVTLNIADFKGVCQNVTLESMNIRVAVVSHSDKRNLMKYGYGYHISFVILIVDC